ncbi:dolichyl-phosphate-mannose-protein mannosyltransferase [Tumebacillus sp. BK434]|uniref:ArnT family glycosyltransferase n=1 Tax=Tumebacillus sp. BK434 TaxID=2512169 RepID=UPI0010DA9A9B|nr:glycosyltransferase family 39 protein [Tumebacillus sp. BK434]TCP57791.1 dolichyl-phosphate-mannose-protein mannosyltransferase [Tumebacillus sp. BK434]
MLRKMGVPVGIALILLFSLWIRLDYIAGLEVKPVSDMEDYDQRAVKLAEEGTFATDHVQGATYRAPGYVIFLGGLYELFGHKYRMVYGVQSLLSVATLFAVYLIGRRLFDTKVAMLALLIGALYVPLIGYSGVLLTESLFLALFTYALYAFLVGSQDGNLYGYLIAGLLFGLATLTRSIALLLPVIAVVWLMLANKTFRLPRPTWIRLGLMVLVMAAVIAPWSIRNYMEQKQFVLVDTTAGLNLLIGNNDYANGFFSDKIYSLPAFKEAMAGTKTDAKRDAIMKAAGKQWILDHPGHFAELTWMRFQMYLSAKKDWVAATHEWERIPLYSDTFHARYQWTLMSLGLVGVVLACWRDRQALLPVLVAGYFLGAISVFFVQTRYQLPAMPYIILLAAYVLRVMGSSPRAAVPIFAAVFGLSLWLEELALNYNVL